MLAYVMCGLIMDFCDLIMDFCGDEITRGTEGERLECLCMRVSFVSLRVL